MKHVGDGEYMNLLNKSKSFCQQQAQVWEPPPANLLKINCDGAFREDTNSGGWGIVIRNENGEVLAVGAGHLQNMGDALQAEAHAALNAIWCASEMGCRRIILETDALNLKQAITSSDFDWSHLGTLFREIKFQLDVSFDSFNISVCPRACNVVAHNLAARGASSGIGSHPNSKGPR